jgi:pimeloyl-ACP methyl ester carboxylesterase
MDTVEVDGLRIAYERAGSGPPLVLLHGFVGDGPTTWAPQLDALSETYTVVAWDAPGAGGSADPPEDFGMAGYADVLAGFVAALDLWPPHVAGLSFGGALAIALADRHPHVPRSLVLASAYAGWRGSLGGEAAEQRLARSLAISHASPDDFVAALLPTMFSEGTEPATVAAFDAALRAFHPVGFRAMSRASAEDLRDALPGLLQPTLLVYGDLDVRAPLPVARHLESEISQARLVVLPGAGHVCSLEAPEAFNAAVRDFLARQVEDGPRPAGGG